MFRVGENKQCPREGSLKLSECFCKEKEAQAMPTRALELPNHRLMALLLSSPAHLTLFPSSYRPQKEDQTPFYLPSSLSSLLLW